MTNSKLSPHYLMTTEREFSIRDCSGVYHLHRINEFGDSVLRIKKGNDKWETCATVTIPRRGEFLLSRSVDGIVFSKRIKFSTITIK